MARALPRALARVTNWLIRPALYAGAVALLVAYLSFFGLNLAALGRRELPIDAWQVAGESLAQTARYLGQVVRGTQADLSRVADAAAKSLPLLGLALTLAALVGIPLGIGAALARHGHLSPSLTLLTVAGVATPSFFLACLLRLGEIAIYRRTGWQVLPVAGFGWDRHAIMPALVLAARPIAQVARVGFVALADVLEADYVRTARAKGLARPAILVRHALRNAAVPILTALGTSLRFALSTLPVVEYLFNWPGLGYRLLAATIRSPEPGLAAGLTLTLALFFVATNTGLEGLSRMADPRLASGPGRLRPGQSWLDPLQAVWRGTIDLPLKLGRFCSRLRQGVGLGRRFPLIVRRAGPRGGGLPGPWVRLRHRGFATARGAAGDQPPTLGRSQGAPGGRWKAPAVERVWEDAIRRRRRRAWVHHTLGSSVFVAGGLVVLALIATYLFGPQWAPHDPSYSISRGLAAPPFAPAADCPLGTDQQGRDILSLLLVGARQTLTVALFAMFARMVVGTLLGGLAGWFAGGLLDRAILAAIDVLGAFPSLLLAMILIFACGIKQGTGAFVAGLCLVGWGEVAQFVRGQVLSIREREYIEAAVAVGLNDVGILLHQALPNLLPSLIALAFLETSGAMALLGELAFVGVFIGGGFQTTDMASRPVAYFDTPEWGAMLANTWRYFRSYPWTTFYPALAFAVAALGLNLFGEGLRRLTERLTVSLRPLSRGTVAAFGLVALVGALGLEAASPWVRYRPMANAFDPQHALAHVRVLASSEMEGRRSGTPGLDRAADYIAGQLRAMGLQPAGEAHGGAYTCLQTSLRDLCDLAGLPQLSLKTPGGQELAPLAYAQDFREYYDYVPRAGSARGEVVLVGASELVTQAQSRRLAGRIALLDGEPPFLERPGAAALLIIAPAERLARHDLPPDVMRTPQQQEVPYLYISEQVAERILAVGGHSLAELRRQHGSTGPGQGLWIQTGVIAEVSVRLAVRRDVPIRNVLAMLPGRDARLAREAIFVVAHYDGLGRWPDGTILPGANDNAAGVAVMLETARLLGESEFQPKRTVFFVAWAPGERWSALDPQAMLAARPGFLEYRVTAVIEVRGVGAGSGQGLALSPASSYRAVQVLRQAARRQGVPTNTQGQVLHSTRVQTWYTRLPYAALSWQDSDQHEHQVTDTADSVNPQKLGRAGRVLALALMYMAGEARY